MACLDAYAAYGGDQWFQAARSLWEDLQPYQISEVDLQFGSHNDSGIVTQCGSGKLLFSATYSEDNYLTITK
jgi:hypothetical protein